mgnify:CR=1 FL=1
MKHKEIAKVISQESIATGVYSMWIQTKDIAAEAVAGQFISVYCKDGAKLLPRPISTTPRTRNNRIAALNGL